MIAALVAGGSIPACAQRSTENVVNAAEDAFGISVGNETIGLYNANSARGFSPELAGNLRVNGLYFDQQHSIPGRLYADTTMRVGLSAQSYPFPAPTGIVDMRLRQAGNRFAGSGAVTYGPYGSVLVEAEAAGPLISDKLGGLAYVSGQDTVNDNRTRYRMMLYGGTLHWTPNETVDVVLFDQGQTGHTTTTQSFIFTAGNAIPPEYDRTVFFGQKWAKRHREVNHFGALMSARVFDDWLLRAGFFRSDQSVPLDHFGFFRDIQPDGSGNLDILRAAPSSDFSYSGEVRLLRAFTEGSRRHTLQFAVRGRDAEHLFGGGASVSLGRAQVGVYDPRPEPTYPTLTPASTNHISQITPAISYVGRWLDVGEFSIGLQKSVFHGEVTLPNAASVRTEARPWLYNGTLAVYLSKDMALYGSYTRGLEESGVAPENASNRGEALPVSLTEQVDAGVRYKLAAGLTLIAGVFEVKKPYFDRNTANLFTQVGNLTHRGVELSFSGQVAPGLTIVAGAMLLRARIDASATVANFFAPIPVGRPNRTVRLNVQYGPASWHGLSIDGQVSQDGPAYANWTNTIRLNANTSLDLGVRYAFTAFGKRTSLRLKALDVTNAYGWTVTPSGSYAPTPPRHFTAQLIADF